MTREEKLAASARFCAHVRAADPEKNLRDAEAWFRDNKAWKLPLDAAVQQFLSAAKK